MIKHIGLQLSDVLVEGESGQTFIEKVNWTFKNQVENDLNRSLCEAYLSAVSFFGFIVTPFTIHTVL
jgi:hypothetical protein